MYHRFPVHRRYSIGGALPAPHLVARRSEVERPFQEFQFPLHNSPFSLGLGFGVLPLLPGKFASMLYGTVLIPSKLGQHGAGTRSCDAEKHQVHHAANISISVHDNHALVCINLLLEAVDGVRNSKNHDAQLPFKGVEGFVRHSLPQIGVHGEHHLDPVRSYYFEVVWPLTINGVSHTTMEDSRVASYQGGEFGLHETSLGEGLA
mmetsp:Transcript_15988/g.35055  ORF Transcript_15988/g.35055 Transcript_15988/m.35055 type:complete len:205 (-) Transcript_15988:926-1540(-)